MSEAAGGNAPSPTVIPRSEHSVSRKQISPSALKVLYRLVEAGYEAYLVGGGVRDLLLGHVPKDFDVATSAQPEEVRSLFRNSRLIGRRFRLAHVRFGRDIIEVATFRAGQTLSGAGQAVTADGRLLSDNVYGNREEDAARRDLTINCLYYDIRDFSILDFAGGRDDLRNRVVRVIGDPEERYREDPVRILRALRFAARLDFSVAPETEAPIGALSRLLLDIPPARLFEEVLKLFLSGHARASFDILERYQVLGYLFPGTAEVLAETDESDPLRALVRQAMYNTDERLANDKPVTPGFLFAALLWPAVESLRTRLLADGYESQIALERAGGEAVAEQAARVSVPRRFSAMTREIWSLQPRLERRHRRDAQALLGRPRFRAAYDFLLLRAQAGEPCAEAARWWTEIQALEPGARNEALSALPRPRRRRRPRRRPG